MDEQILRLAAAPPTRALVVEMAGKTSEAWELSREAFHAGEIRAAVNLGLAAAHRGEPAPVDHLVNLLPVTEDVNLAIALLAAAGDRMMETALRSCESGRNLPDRQGLYLHLAAGTLDGATPPPELLVSIRQSSRNPQTPSSRVFLGLAARAVGDPDVLAVVGRMAEEAERPTAKKLGDGFLRQLRRPLLELLPEEARPEQYAGFTVKQEGPRVGRNDPCPCGSGKKYKRCCLGTEETGVRPDPTVPVGNRARHHRSMSDRQFHALHPVEVLQIPPDELPTARLGWAMRWLARFRDFDAAGRYLDEYLRREDRETGDAFNDLLAEMIGAAGSSRDADAVERFAVHIDGPEKNAPHTHLTLALLREAPDRLERMERVAKAALTDETGESAEFLSHQLLFFTPALGILVARGAVASGCLERPLMLLDRIEWARDELLLPPHDPAGLVHDLLSEHELERQLENEAIEENEKLAAEAEELRQALNGAKAREMLARRHLERQERKLQKAQADAERAREAAAELRSTEHDPEKIEELRRKVESYRVTIAEGNEERRSLREKLSVVGAKAEASSSQDRGEEEDEDDDGLEVAEDAVPDRLSLRIPEYSGEFRDGVRSVAPHVGRDALATAGRIAGGDPAAWMNVKRVKAIDGLYSVRLGRHRGLFRLEGEDSVVFERLIHRRDLDATLRKMA